MTQREKKGGLFQNVERMLNEGKYGEALQLVRGLEKQQLDNADELRLEVLESKCLMKLSEYEASLQMSSQVAEKCVKVSGCRWIEIDASIIMAESLWRLGRLDESFEVLERSERNLQNLVLHTLVIHTAVNREVAERRAALLYHKGTVYLLQSAFSQALEHYRQSLTLYEEIGSTQDVAAVLNVIGIVFNQKGDFNHALEYYQRSLVLKEGIGNELDVAKALNNIGTVYYDQGDLDAALEHYQRSLALREELGNKQDVAHSFNNIGEVYFRRGNLDDALEYFQRSLMLLEEIGNKHGISHLLKNIGEVYFRRNSPNRALEYYDQSLALRVELGNKREMSETLFHMISAALGSNLLDEARQHLKRLQQINNQEDIKIIGQRYRVAEALVLKMSIRSRDRAKAELLLNQVVEEEIVAHELTVIALLGLCDLLLVDLQISGDTEILESLHEFLNRLLQIVADQNSFWLMAEAHVLHSKLALLNLDVMEARRLLTEAQRIADERGLGQLAIKISNEHDALLDELNAWDDLTKRQAPLTKRANLARIGDHVERMSRLRVDEIPDMPEEKPISVMILAKGGIVVFSKAFESTTEADENLIGGLFDAIRSCGEELFSQALDRIKLKTYTVLVKRVEPFTICYVYLGQSYGAQQRVLQFIQAVPRDLSVWNLMLESATTGQTLSPPAHDSLEGLLNEVFAIST